MCEDFIFYNFIRYLQMYISLNIFTIYFLSIQNKNRKRYFTFKDRLWKVRYCMKNNDKELWLILYFKHSQCHDKNMNLFQKSTEFDVIWDKKKIVNNSLTNQNVFIAFKLCLKSLTIINFLYCDKKSFQSDQYRLKWYKQSISF